MKENNNNIPKGYKQTKLGVIPEEWDLIKISELGEICKINLGNNTNSNYQFNYIDLSSVKNGKINFPKEKITYKDSPSRARRVLNNGSLKEQTKIANILSSADKKNRYIKPTNRIAKRAEKRINSGIVEWAN